MMRLLNEELSFQFTLSYLTFLNKNQYLPVWYIEENKSQLGFNALRYQLAFLSYASVSLCYKTLSYRQICSEILDDSLNRMINNISYYYITFWWGPNTEHICPFCIHPNNATWKQLGTYPDPMRYQNIMYSGHLAHMLTLYEAVTNNNKYSLYGWNFTYKGYTFHYNTSKLLNILNNMVLNKYNKQGGIPCEPFRVFLECNQHQNIAFNLYQHIYNTTIYNKALNKFIELLK